MTQLPPTRRRFSGRRWLLLFPLLALVAALWAARCLLTPPTFTATAQTQIVTDTVAAELGVPPEPGYAPDSSGVPPAQQNVDHINDLLNDDLPGGFIDTALKQANLDRPINLDPAVHDARFALLRKNMSVAAQSSTAFAIGLTWDRPGECQRIIESLRQQYIQEVGLERKAQSVATSKFIDSQLDSYKARMRTAEAGIPSLNPPPLREKTQQFGWEYPVLLAQYRDLLRRREQLRFKGSLDQISASSSLSPIGSVYAAPTVRGAWEAPRLPGSMAVALLLVWVTLLVRRRAAARRGPDDGARLVTSP